jgi:hypothetical protein
MARRWFVGARWLPRCCAIAVVSLFFASAAHAAEPAADEAEFFEKKIRPILVEQCYKCHSAQAEKLKGKLLLDSREGARKGGESGAAVVPGDPDASLLVQALRYENFEMPPSGKLPASVIADFERWIKHGAIDPRESSAVPSAAPAFQPTIDFAAGRQFWSFQPPKRYAPPEVSNIQWPRQALDSFIMARLDEAQLAPAPPADRRSWLRRVTLDLTGLPPTPDAVAAFEADTSPDARERVVDRLLASPHFGERVARLWLDLARYAEDQAHIVGKDDSLFYPNAYLYRDWLIGAFNRDLPYDQFVRLQLAADLIEGEESPNLPALGFIGLGPKYYSRRSLQVMSDEWEDRVDIVGRGLLGLTVACARCHDHKFDPIGTEDYYALAGVFASTAMFNRPLKADVEKADDSQKDNKEFENGKKLSGEAKTPKDAMHIVKEGTQTDLNIFIRGSVDNKGPQIPRHFLRILCSGEPQPFASGSGRRDLADAIASGENPLTARVIVNRIWGLYFGRPLVGTASNYGAMGERPTHPELLDDLTVRFMQSDWSLKWLTREIVLSTTYGQSSDNSNPKSKIQNLKSDPENRLLSRMNRRRLSVEQWRDSILAANGRLEDAVGGPSIDPQNPQERRRTVYSRASRLELNKLLVMFDYPDPNVHADRRVETTTPLQKMFVLNSPFMVEQSGALADRLLTEITAGQNADSEDVAAADRQRIERAYRLLYGRPASDEEIKIGLQFLAKTGKPENSAATEPTTDHAARWKQYAHVLLAANELLYVD